MKEKIRHFGIYKLYTLLFFGVFFIVFLPLSIRNLNIGFSGLFYDAFTQYVVFTRDFATSIREWLFNGQNFKFFDFDIGLGASTISSYGYYGLFDPFNIIAVLLPTKWVEFSCYLIVVIKLYFSGFFFMLFAKKVLISNKLALVTSSILYVFNSIVLLASLRHFIFAGALMIFPLVLLGAYKVIKNERPYLLIFSTLYALLAQFYLYAYVAFGFEIFVLVKSYVGKNNKKQYIINLVKTNLFFLLGTLMGAFVLFTQLYAVLNNGRSSGNSLTNYSLAYYATLIFSTFIPTPGMAYTNSIGNFFAAILVLLFYLNIKKEKWMKIWLGVQLPLLLSSICGYVLSLFSYANNRWSFIILVPICLIVGYMLENIKDISREKINLSIKISFITLDLALVLISAWGIFNYLYLPTFCLIIIFFAVLGVFLFIGYKLYKFDFNKFKIKTYDTSGICKDFIKVNVVLIFLFNIGMCYAFTDGYVINKYYNNEFRTSLINDDGFYRVSKYGFAGNNIRRTNDSIYGEYSSTFFYGSVNNSNILDFIEYFNVNNENGDVGYNGMGKRYILETIAGVKYYVVKDSENRSAPYNFSYYSDYESIKFDQSDLNSAYDKFLKENGEYVKEKNTIYMNNNSLPLGYIYSNYINKEEMDNLNSLERQVYLSKAAIVENDEEVNGEEYTIGIHQNLINELAYQIIDSKGISINSNQIIVDSSDNYLTFKVTNDSNSEIYFEINGLENTNREKRTIVEYSSDDEHWIETIYSFGEFFYIDNQNHLLYMGYDENASERTITLKFKNAGVHNYESLKFYGLSMDGMVDDIERLNENVLENIKIVSNGIKGNITVAKDSFLFLSIPFDEGFRAYVNGVETEILKTNITYMGINLTEGYNEIVLKYEQPHFNLGLKVALIAASVLFVYSIVDAASYVVRKKKHRTRISSDIK